MAGNGAGAGDRNGAELGLLIEGFFTSAPLNDAQSATSSWVQIMTLSLAGPSVPAVPRGQALQPAARPALGRRAKAAVIVRLLLTEGADIPIEDLPEDLQAALTAQMGRMGLIDRDTLTQVVTEFADELDAVGLSFPRGMAGALSMLDGKISAQTATRLRRENGVRAAGDPWDRLRQADLGDLVSIAQTESTEVAAVMLAKLETAKAAALLGRLPGPLARRITYAVSLTGAVTPDAVDRIGLSLATRLDTRAPRAFTATPSDRVGEILNRSPAATRDDLLEGLDQQDSDFATAVRRALFTFAHIPERVSPRDVARILREVDQGVAVTALAFAERNADYAATAEFLLSGISARLADALREEVAERTTPADSEGEEALITIIDVIRRLETQGDIVLAYPEPTGDDPAGK